MFSCQCIVEGRVQGVGFRYFTQRAAALLGLRGWVRNLPGGDVEIRVEGEEKTVREFLEQVRRGPSFSRVTQLSVQETTPQGFADFRIEV